jgi:broad specificity phosphatase PhoE
MTRLVLIRHGETEGNVSQVWHGALDAPLTSRGQAQVKATAERMRQLARVMDVEAFYVSPLARAQSTAAAIATAIGMTPIVEAGLREFDLGDWEGRSFEELHREENLWGRWKVDPRFAPPNGESPHTFNQRAVKTVSELVANHPGKTVLIVTHGGVICNVLATWLGDGPADWRRWEPHNCAISILEQADDHWRGVLINDTGHLPANAVVEETPVWAS